MDIVSSPKVGRSLPKKPSCLLWEDPVCEKHIPKPVPNGTKFSPGMLIPLHDSMPSFMNFRWVLDLPEFKNQVSQRFAGNQQCHGVWISFPSLAWDLEIHPQGNILDFSTNLSALEHVLVVQIWIMHIKCLETQLMHKNAKRTRNNSKI